MVYVESVRVMGPEENVKKLLAYFVYRKKEIRKKCENCSFVRSPTLFSPTALGERS
jgi:hypothetical protein